MFLCYLLSHSSSGFISCFVHSGEEVVGSFVRGVDGVQVCWCPHDLKSWKPHTIYNWTIFYFCSRKIVSRWPSINILSQIIRTKKAISMFFPMIKQIIPSEKRDKRFREWHRYVRSNRDVCLPSLPRIKSPKYRRKLCVSLSSTPPISLILLALS